MVPKHPFDSRQMSAPAVPKLSSYVTPKLPPKWCPSVKHEANNPHLQITKLLCRRRSSGCEGEEHELEVAWSTNISTQNQVDSTQLIIS